MTKQEQYRTLLADVMTLQGDLSDAEKKLDILNRRLYDLYSAIDDKLDTLPRGLQPDGGS